MAKPVNPYASAYRHFVEETTEHELHILQDSGLYTHLRVQAPGTRMWSWDITTWPGYLATSGDIADGYMFTREPDMIGFFCTTQNYYADGAPDIDFHYWAQKLAGGRTHEAREYSEDVFRAHMRDALSENDELDETQRAEIYDDACSYGGSDHEAHEWLADNEEYAGGNTWEWDLRDWDVHFLYACYAINAAVQLYLAHTAKHGTPEPYVVVQDGGVQNRPSIPVYQVPSRATAEHNPRLALEVRTAIAKDTRARRALARTLVELDDVIREHGSEPIRAALDEHVDAELARAEWALTYRERLAFRV